MANWNTKTVRLKSIAGLVLLSGLSACSTTQKPQENINTTTNIIAPAEPEVLSAQQLYSQALELKGDQQRFKLVAAQKQALAEQDWQTLQDVSDTLLKKHPRWHTQALLVRAYAQIKLGNPNNALRESASVQAQLSTPEHFYWHQLVQGATYAYMRLNNQAVPFLLRASESADRYGIDDAEVNPLLWQSLQGLTTEQLQGFNNGSSIQQGWIQLALIKQLYLGQPVELHSASNNWQRRNPDHPASFALDEKVAQLMQVEPYKVANLGVFLPLSGGNRTLGEAVKNGVIAALDKHKFNDVYFIDANLSNEEIQAAISANNIDFAIGPLLKGNINRFEQQALLEGIPSIYLNRSDYLRQSSQHFYFALAPEHELDQALQHFMAQGVKKPLILASNDRSGTRLSEYFSTQWLRYNEQAPLVGLFDDNKAMEQVISDILEVGQSEARIELIESLFKQKVESETRSRRDIDVIYLLADATQTRLLKPYLDVNVSTFVDRIPLYASSKSHSTQIDSSDKRDLNGLYFTELPWMLPTTGVNNMTNRQLKETVQGLWPNQADIEQRLFAMGYDAITVIPELRQLSMLPGKSLPGLTGQLSVNSEGEVVRHLAWAHYQSRQIAPVNLEHISPTPLLRQELKQDPEQQPQEESSDVLATEGMAQH